MENKTKLKISRTLKKKWKNGNFHKTTCTKCGVGKKSSEFYKDKSHKDGLMSQCKSCNNKHSKKYRVSHKQESKKYNKEYNYSHKKERTEYRQLHKKEIKKYRTEYYKSHKEAALNYRQKYAQSHEKEIKVYKQLHKQERNKRENQRKKIDINYRILCNLRTRLTKALKKNSKSNHTMFLIGCEVEYLMYHLQSHFTKGMNWDNYGKWHIDHIKPCALFDLSKPSEQRKCFRYTNLQPLWGKDNLKKGYKLL